MRCVSCNLWSAALGSILVCPLGSLLPCTSTLPSIPLPRSSCMVAMGVWRGEGGRDASESVRTHIVLDVAVLGQARCNSHAGHTRPHCLLGGNIGTTPQQWETKGTKTPSSQS